MKTYECYYSMYIQYRGIKSIVTGENIIDAIKKSNKNAILSRIIDEDGTEYFVKEHDEASPDKYFDYYWVDNNGNVLYDEKEDKWGDYYKREKLREEILNKPPILGDDLKVRVVACNNKLIFIPNKPFENIGDDWCPVNDNGIIGSSLSNTSKNLGISEEALELMRLVKRGNDAIGDIDWFKLYNDEYVFSWIGGLYRILDPLDSVTARGFSIYKNQCQIIENTLNDEIINSANQQQYIWKKPFRVTEIGLNNYNRKNKLLNLTNNEIK